MKTLFLASILFSALTVVSVGEDSIVYNLFGLQKELRQDHRAGQGYSGATRYYFDSTGVYQIVYLFSGDVSFVPATNPPGKNHYSAIIKVYEITEADTVQIGESIIGTYVPGGCFEDIPSDWVSKAKNHIE